MIDESNAHDGKDGKTEPYEPEGGEDESSVENQGDDEGVHEDQKPLDVSSHRPFEADEAVSKATSKHFGEVEASDTQDGSD